MTLIDSYNFQGLQFELHGQASAQASHPGLAMNIFSSLRILGGGAIVESTGAGNLLWASYPLSGQEWEKKPYSNEVRCSSRT